MTAIDGGWDLHGTRVSVARPGRAPRARVATLLEEDTALVMSPSLDASRAQDDPAVRVYTDLHAFDTLAPGGVLVRRQRPLALALVVLDLDASPISRIDWVGEALVRAFVAMRKAGCVEARLPLLGVRRGGLEPAAFGRILRDAIEAVPSGHRPERLGIEATVAAVRAALEDITV